MGHKYSKLEKGEGKWENSKLSRPQHHTQIEKNLPIKEDFKMPTAVLPNLDHRRVKSLSSTSSDGTLDNVISVRSTLDTSPLTKGVDVMDWKKSTIKTTASRNDQLKTNLSIDSRAGSTISQPNVLEMLGYELHERIGSGGFSTVFVAYNRNIPGVKFACKMFQLDQVNRRWAEKCLKSEMRIMMKVHHPNIITAYDAFKTRTRAYIFMKFAQNGSIDAYLSNHCDHGRATEEQVKRWFSGMISAIAYLHHYNIAHRDLKLENFLLDENLEPQLTDFSFAVISDKQGPVELLQQTVCGTPLYMAPEIHSLYKNQWYDAKKADIYSMGVCLFEMLHGYKPFEGFYPMKSQKLIERQLNRDYRFDLSLNLSLQCRQLIDRMLEPRPEKRPKAKHILKSAWFRYNR